MSVFDCVADDDTLYVVVVLFDLNPLNFVFDIKAGAAVGARVHLPVRQRSQFTRHRILERRDEALEVGLRRLVQAVVD